MSEALKCNECSRVETHPYMWIRVEPHAGVTLYGEEPRMDFDTWDCLAAFAEKMIVKVKAGHS